MPKHLFAVFFEDDPAFLAQRSLHMAAHLAFLQAHPEIIAAGPLQSSIDQTPAGGLWCVDVNTADDVERLVQADPFWPTGLRKSVQVLSWNLVNENFKRLA